MPRVLGSAVAGSSTPVSAAASPSALPALRRPSPLTLFTTPTSATPSSISTTHTRANEQLEQRNSGACASPRARAPAGAIDEPLPSSWALQQQARANERASQRMSQAATQQQNNSDDEAADDAAAMDDLLDAADAAASGFQPPTQQSSPPNHSPAMFKSTRVGSSLPLPVVDEQDEQDEEARDKMNDSKYDSPEPHSKQTSSNSSSDRSGPRSSGSGSGGNSDGRSSDPTVSAGSHFGFNSLSQSASFGDIQFSQIDTMDEGSQSLSSEPSVAAAAASTATTQMSLTLSTSEKWASTMSDEPSGTPPLTQVSPPQPTRTIGGAAAQLHAQQQRRAFYKQPVAKNLLPVKPKPVPLFAESPPAPRQPEPERPVQPIHKEPEAKPPQTAQPLKHPFSAAARQFDAIFSASQPTPSTRDNSVRTQPTAAVGAGAATASPAQQPQSLPKQMNQPQQPSSSTAPSSTIGGTSGASAPALPVRKRDHDPEARANSRRQREERYRELYPKIRGNVEAARDLIKDDLVAVLCCQGVKNITKENKPLLLSKVLPLVSEDKLAMPVVRAARSEHARSSQGASKKLPNLALYATQPANDSDDEGEPMSLSQGNKRHKATHTSSQEHAMFEQPTKTHAAAAAAAAAFASDTSVSAIASAPVSRSSALQPWVAAPLIFRHTKYLRPPCTELPPYSPSSFVLHAGSEVVVVAAEYMRFRVEHMFAINQLAALQSQQEAQQRFVKARHTINSLSIPSGLVQAKVVSFYPIAEEELSNRKPQHGGGAACRGWNHPAPSPWCELTLQVTEGEFAGEHFTLFYIDALWVQSNDAPSERRQLTVKNCALFLLEKTRYDQLRSHDWSVGDVFQMPLVSYSTLTTEQGCDEPMVPVPAAPSAANLVVVLRVGRIVSIKPVFPPHIDPMNFAEAPYHAFKVLWLTVTKPSEGDEKLVYDAWNQDIPCVSPWEILPHSTGADLLATCMSPIAAPSHGSEQGFKAVVRRYITKTLQEIYELGWRPLWLRQPQSSQVSLFSSLMTTPVSALVAVRQQFIEICENHQRGFYSDWNAVQPELLSLLRSLNDLEHEYGSAGSISAAYPGLVSIAVEAPLPLDLAQLNENCQTSVLEARLAAEAAVEHEWSEQCPLAMGAVVAAISKLIHARVAVEPTWTDCFGAMQINETATNGAAVRSEGTRTRDTIYTKLSQLMTVKKLACRPRSRIIESAIANFKQTNVDANKVMQDPRPFKLARGEG